jgi:hypothetical protein
MKAFSEMSIEEKRNYESTLQAYIDEAKSMERLMLNADFKKLFIEGYTDKELKRLVNILSDPALAVDKNYTSIVQDINNSIIGVSKFNNFKNYVIGAGKRAEKELDDYRNYATEQRNN